MSTGANFPEALHKYEEQLSKAADCNHMKVLVVGQKLAEDEAHFTELLSYLREKELYPRNTYVCLRILPTICMQSRKICRKI